MRRWLGLRIGKSGEAGRREVGRNIVWCVTGAAEYSTVCVHAAIRISTVTPR